MSFSISKPNTLNAIFPPAQDNLTQYVNGSSASGYWLSVKDLCKFGIWINKLFNKNDNIKQFIIKNNLVIYEKDDINGQILRHWGFLGSSSSCLETFLDKNTTIVVLSNKNYDVHILMKEIKNILQN